MHKTKITGYRADPNQVVQLQIDENTMFFIEIDAFHTIARQQAHTNN